MSKSLAKAVKRAKLVKGNGCVCGVGCGKTDYTAKLKVFRVKVLSVAIIALPTLSCKIEI